MSVTQICPNFDKEPINVWFYLLEPFDKVSSYKCECPVCENGALVMERDYETGELKNTDRCVGCGQRVVYDDIELVRIIGGWQR